jgi:hypothetical protein
MLSYFVVSLSQFGDFTPLIVQLELVSAQPFIASLSVLLCYYRYTAAVMHKYCLALRSAEQNLCCINSVVVLIVAYVSICIGIIIIFALFLS